MFPYSVSRACFCYLIASDAIIFIVFMPVWEEDTTTAHHRLEVTGGEAVVQVLVVVVAMEAMLGISQLVFW
jgi:hypothetical protein